MDPLDSTFFSSHYSLHTSHIRMNKTRYYIYEVIVNLVSLIHVLNIIGAHYYVSMKHKRFLSITPDIVFLSRMYNHQ